MTVSNHCFRFFSGKDGLNAAFGDQGGFFEKSPPWTPQKTFD
jgi:hypothetical protein